MKDLDTKDDNTLFQDICTLHGIPHKELFIEQVHMLTALDEFEVSYTRNPNLYDIGVCQNGILIVRE